MTRVAVFRNGVQDKVRFFKDRNKAYQYAHDEMTKFGENNTTKVTDLSTNLNMTTGLVKKRMAFENGDVFEAWLSGDF